MAYSYIELWYFKVIKVDVCGSLVLSDSVTFNIVSETFSCQGAQGNFENTVVFRANVTVQGPASIITANDIVNDISNWVQTSPSISVASVVLDIDPNCLAMPNSFNSPDCVVVTVQPTPSPSSPTSSSSSSSSTIGIIVAVVVAVVIIIILLVIIVVLMGRRKKASYRYLNANVHTLYIESF